MRIHLLVLLLAVLPLSAQSPKELGAVKWQRDFDAALADAKKKSKPVLVLFQEVPG